MCIKKVRTRYSETLLGYFEQESSSCWYIKKILAQYWSKILCLAVVRIFAAEEGGGKRMH